jgi:hypothetical protein
LKEVFWFGLQKRLKNFIVNMPRPTLEEATESTNQVEDDMISGRSRTKRKHWNFTSFFSSSTSSSSFSLEEKEIRSQKDKKKKKTRDKEQTKTCEKKAIEKEKLLLVEARIRL